jgi:hypothetical protein
MARLAVDGARRCEALCTGMPVAVARRIRCHLGWTEVVGGSKLCRRHAKVFRAGHGLRHDAGDKAAYAERRRQLDALNERVRARSVALREALLMLEATTAALTVTLDIIERLGGVGDVAESVEG